MQQVKFKPLKAKPAASAEISASYIRLELPIRVVSEANQRDHYMAKHSRKVAQQAELTTEWRRLVKKHRLTLPVTVRFTRIGPKALDSDNLAGSFKHVRDSLAKILGVDDGDDRISFTYAQQANGKRVYGIQIEIQQAATIPPATVAI